jgi:PPM family protein phosphatase
MKSNFLDLTDKGMVRSGNQDSHYVDPAGRFCIVADGMGGHAGGEEASQIAIKTIKEHIEQNWNDSIEINVLLEEALLSANQAIVEDQMNNPQRADMGTTAVMLLFESDRVWAAHVGDSRLYRFRGEELMQVTEDDTWVARAMKMNQLTAEEARTHPLRHVLSHCLGRRDLRQVNIRTVDIKPGDTVLLCSDGLTEEVSDEEITTYLKSKSVEELPQTLVEAAKTNGGSDNITVVLGVVETVVPAASVEASEN